MDFTFSQNDFDDPNAWLPTLKAFNCPFVAPEEQEDTQAGTVADKDRGAIDP